MTPASKGSPAKGGLRRARLRPRSPGTKRTPPRVGATAGRTSRPYEKEGSSRCEESSHRYEKGHVDGQEGRVHAGEEGVLDRGQEGGTGARRPRRPRRPRPRRRRRRRRRRPPRRRRRRPTAKKAAPATKKAATSAAARAGNGAGAAPPVPHDLHAQAEASGTGAAEDRPLRQGCQVPRRSARAPRERADDLPGAGDVAPGRGGLARPRARARRRAVRRGVGRRRHGHGRPRAQSRAVGPGDAWPSRRSTTRCVGSRTRPTATASAASSRSRSPGCVPCRTPASAWPARAGAVAALTRHGWWRSPSPWSWWWRTG